MSWRCSAGSGGSRRRIYTQVSDVQVRDGYAAALTGRASQQGGTP